MSTKSYADKLRLSDSLRETAIRQAIAALHLPRSSQGLDAGCGIGSHAKLLVEAISPGGRVTGIDTSDEFLKIARDEAAAGLGDRVSFRRADVGALPTRMTMSPFSTSMRPGPLNTAVPSSSRRFAPTL